MGKCYVLRVNLGVLYMFTAVVKSTYLCYQFGNRSVRERACMTCMHTSSAPVQNFLRITGGKKNGCNDAQWVCGAFRPSATGSVSRIEPGTFHCWFTALNYYFFSFKNQLLCDVKKTGLIVSINNNGKGMPYNISFDKKQLFVFPARYFGSKGILQAKQQ